jgi:translation elongation factor EF-4
VLDFYDQPKSRTRGYASLTMTWPASSRHLVRVDVLVAGEPVDAPR